jgi:hypothetical protein
VFRKFLLFTSCLLTLASQNGYAAISLDSPKAVLQRGTYTKVTLSFTLSNISAQELATYEMGRAEAEDGVRALTRYLDICVNTEAGKKCTEGPSIKKVRYLTNSEFDKTPELELSNEYVVGFTAGSPRFEIPTDDITQTYRNLYVTMEITASGTPFSTDTYIAMRLLPGTNTTSTDYKDAEVKPKLAVAANDVIESFALRPSKSTLTATWDQDEQIDLANGEKSTPDGVIAFHVEETKWNSLFIPLHTYNETSPQSESTLDNACQIVPDADNKTCEVDCPGATGADNYYLKADDLTAANIPFVASGNSGNISITGLDNEMTYAVVLQSQPDGLKRLCLISKPSDAVTLSELGGGPEPKVKDPRCFIATAAYGSPLDPHLNTLRWFRDNVLLVTDFGQDMVQLYYRVSPPLADFIATRPTLRTVTRGALWLPVLVIEFWRERPSLLLTLSAMASTFLLLFLRRRSLRASV